MAEELETSKIQCSSLLHSLVVQVSMFARRYNILTVSYYMAPTHHALSAHIILVDPLDILFCMHKV
jgi:hypothetical protein